MSLHKFISELKKQTKKTIHINYLQFRIMMQDILKVIKLYDNITNYVLLGMYIKILVICSNVVTYYTGDLLKCGDL